MPGIRLNRSPSTSSSTTSSNGLTWNDVVSGLSATLEALRATTILVPHLSESLGILLGILKLIENAQASDEGCIHLLDRAIEGVKAVKATVERREGDEETLQRIKIVERALTEIKNYVEKALKKSAVARILTAPKTSADVKRLEKVLEDSLTFFTIDVVTSTEVTVRENTVVLERVEEGMNILLAASSSPPPESHPEVATVALNQYLMGIHELELLEYKDRQDGPDHCPIWTVDCLFNGDVIGTGTGQQKRAAKEVAAAHAYRSLTGIVCRVLME